MGKEETEYWRTQSSHLCVRTPLTTPAIAQLLVLWSTRAPEQMPLTDPRKVWAQRVHLGHNFRFNTKL